MELTFGGTYALPVDNVPPVLVRFCHGTHAVVVPGFWDGETTYRVRFLPELVGTWTWRTEAERAGIRSASGAFTVLASAMRGAVRVAHRFHFAHADGTPFRPVGTTVYNWLHQDEPVRRETVAAIAGAGFNKLRFLIFPQAGGYVEHEPTLMPFARDGGEWDVSAPSIPFFRQLDAAVELLGAHGIQADVLIFNAYDRGHFGLNQLSAAEDDVYLRYLVARLSAYPNVWWSLCNEFDQLGRRPGRWHRVGALLAQLDPSAHVRSIHNWIELYDNNQDWVTHASVQNGSATVDFGRASLYRDVWGKPVILDEIKYEGDIPERWGAISGRQLVHRFWVAAVSGCYASHGESLSRNDGSLHVVAGGSLHGEAPARLGFLRDILDGLVVDGLDPIDKWDDPAFVAGAPRRQYLQYFGRSAPEQWSFRLPQGPLGERLMVGDAFDVDLIDTWHMTITSAGRRFTLTEVAANDAYDRAGPPLDLPAGQALALRITRIE
ncbi:DUF5605 domain-containing protein [Microbacterium kribbense]|uniref:DUF5605 domain-containing protein n=1 Tax=Microbacterium kribbense TaxID=433645 RepID=A0ABP7G9K4_9MICO